MSKRQEAASSRTGQACFLGGRQNSPSPGWWLPYNNLLIHWMCVILCVRFILFSKKKKKHLEKGREEVLDTNIKTDSSSS